MSVPVHAAHVGLEVEVFYRWHALSGRRLRRAYSERRATGELFHVEVGNGVVVAVAGWMLHEAVCSHNACRLRLSPNRTACWSKLGASAEQAPRIAGNVRRRWRNSAMELNRVLPIAYFDRLGVPRFS